MSRVFAGDFGKRRCEHLEAGGHAAIHIIPSLSHHWQYVLGKTFYPSSFALLFRTDRRGPEGNMTSAQRAVYLLVTTAAAVRLEQLLAMYDHLMRHHPRP